MDVVEELVLACMVLLEACVLLYCRKAYRLGKWLADLNAIRKMPLTTRFSYLEILASGGEGVYYFVEQLTWCEMLTVICTADDAGVSQVMLALDARHGIESRDRQSEPLSECPDAICTRLGACTNDCEERGENGNLV